MRLLTREQAQALDRISMKKLDISGNALMGSAGKRIAELATRMMSHVHDPSIFILCGKGNNGGDGFAAGAELYSKNFNVAIHSIPDWNAIKGDALPFFNTCEELGILITFGEDNPSMDYPDLIIDGLLGTGYKGAIRPHILPWIDWINETNSKILSIDIPSGLDANSAQVNPEAVSSDATLTFGAHKVGMIFRNGKEHCGQVEIGKIGFPELAEINLPGVKWNLFEESTVKSILKKPELDIHKHSAGKVLVIAGSRGMTGAAILATYGALRSGTGLTLTSAPSSLNEIYEREITEGMTLVLDDDEKGSFSLSHADLIMEKVDWADSVVLGPGLGRKKETKELIRELVFSIDKPLVLDADGLFPFSKNIRVLNERNSPLVITPHFGELSQLTDMDADRIRDDFPNVMTDLMKEFRHIALVKQVPACIFFNDDVQVNTTGNPGLATGGTGDVLSGIIASFIAQGYDHFEAVCLAAFIHGKASDMLIKEKGFRGQIASDLISTLPAAISEYEKS